MRVAKLAIGLAFCAGLASCNWYDIPSGQRCCSGGITNSTTSTVQTTTTVDPRAFDGYGYQTPAYVCRVEPSQTKEGYEVIAYPAEKAPWAFVGEGIVVPCP